MNMTKWSKLLNETTYIMADNVPNLKSDLPNLSEISFGKMKMFFSYGNMVGFSNKGKVYVVNQLSESKKEGNHVNFLTKHNPNATRLSYDELINTFNRVL